MIINSREPKLARLTTKGTRYLHVRQSCPFKKKKKNLYKHSFPILKVQTFLNPRRWGQFCFKLGHFIGLSRYLAKIFVDFLGRLKAPKKETWRIYTS